MFPRSSSARVGRTMQDYRRLGLDPDRIAQWEDGARTDGAPGTYEWWYFDAHLADGAKLVIAFYTKLITNIRRPLSPMIRIDLDLPDGTSLIRKADYAAADYESSTERCDVRISDNVFAGDLHSYRIQARIDDVTVDVELTADVPAWRPWTGHLLFGDRGQHCFAWLPAIPQGTVRATYAVAGDTHRTTGVGYHDHNWGNHDMSRLMHNWYWARGQAGGFSVIASYITTTRRYGFEGLPVFLLAKDGEIVADDADKVTFATEDVRIDAHTGKPYANVSRYSYRDGDERYVVTFTRDRDLAHIHLIDGVTGPTRIAARLIRFDGAYLRFAGELSIEHHKDDHLVEHQRASAIWERMYFGRTIDEVRTDAP